VIRRVCRILHKRVRFPRIGRKAGHTKEKFVFVDDISDAEIDSSEDDNERLLYAVQHRDHKHQYRLRIHHAIIDHRRCIQFRKVYSNTVTNETRHSRENTLPPLGVLVRNNLSTTPGMITPRFNNCSGIIPNPCKIT